MENILMTSEEMQRQKELFEYEMTQVILNLKGEFEKYDVSNSPINLAKDFADEVKNKHLDFTPFTKVESIEYHFEQESLDKGTSKIQEVCNTNIKLEFMKCIVPQIKNGMVYTPFLLEDSIHLADGVDELCVINHTEYKKLETEEVDVEFPSFQIKTNMKQYNPISKIEINPYKCEVHGEHIDFVYEKYEMGEVQMTDELNNLNEDVIEIKYSPWKQSEIKGFNFEISNIITLSKIDPLPEVVLENIDYQTPKIKKFSEMKINKQVELENINFQVPRVNTNYNFDMKKNSEIKIEEISKPTIKSILDYIPLNINKVRGISFETPKVKIMLEEFPTKNIEPKIRPIDRIPEEITKPIDFYAIWNSL